MKKFYTGILLSVLSGLMLAFSFPTMIQGKLLPDLGFLCWVSLVPLFFAIRDARPLRAFLYSFAMGVVCYSITIWWIYRALKVYGGITTSLSIFITALLIFLVSAFAGLACSIAVWLHRKSRAEFILLISVSWVVVEYLRHYIPFGGFPWANLAMSQASYLPVIQIVDLVGLFGVIFLIVWANYFIVELILKLRHEYVSLFWAKMAITLVLLISTIAYGYIRIDQFQGGFDSDGITVGVIQGNVAQEDKWNRDKAENNLSFYRESAKQLSLVPVDLIVWPEAAFPYLIKMPFYAIDPAKLGVVPTLGSPLPYTLLGAVTEDVNRRFGNSALLFDSKGMLQDVFNKAHLVPFGEYVPLRKLFFFIDKITTFPSDDMVAGTSFEPFNLGNHKISMLICYEDIFPDISRREVLNGSEILVNLTNDAWYGVSSAAYQHLALAIFRAVENRRYLIRSTNTGVSAIITATGNLVASTGLFEQAILVNQIPFMNDKTLYTRLGDWFAWGMGLYLLIAIVAVIYRKIKNRY